MIDPNVRRVLQEIHSSVLERFTYVSDPIKWGQAEYWASPSELPLEGPFSGDCDDFALMCRQLCRKAGIPSRLLFCKVEDRKSHHLVCESNGFILDNRAKTIVRFCDLDYEWLYISGYEKGEWWHKVSVI